MKKDSLVEKIGINSNNVNLVRFVAALTVIFSHAFYVSEAKEDPLSVLTKGQVNMGGIAVGVFFFLSGLYVSKSFYKSGCDVKNYMIKRCNRVFPQLWSVVFISVFILGALCTTNNIVSYFTNRGTYLYLLNGFLIPIHNLPGVFSGNVYISTVNGPLWTMPVEFFGYILIVVIYLIAKKIRLKSVSFKSLFLLCMTGLLVLLFAFSYIIKSSFLVAAVRAFLFFVIGVLFYCYKDSVKYSRVLFFAFVCMLVLLVKLPVYNFVLIICLPYVILAISLFVRQIPKTWDMWKCSYEMYLVGWPIQQVITMMFGGKMSALMNFVLTVPFDLIIAYLLYKSFEYIQSNNK
ncbi:MAG: acyltransferase [Lachnospiraceae bacterium]|nr:acyltransferase [Lachnospiraceae bacterium]